MTIARPAPRAPALAHRRPLGVPASNHAMVSHAIDGVAVFVAISAPLYNRYIGAVTIVAMVGVLAVYLWLRRDRLQAIMGASAVPMLMPALALLSTLWSIAPSATAHYGTLYAMTALLGLALGAGSDRSGLLWGLFAAFGTYVWVSFLFGEFVGWGGGIEADTGLAYAGISPSKNMSADTAALAMLASVAAVGQALAGRRLALLAAALLTILPCCWILWYARSTGGLVAGAVATLCCTLWLSSQRFQAQSRGLLFAVCVLLVAVAIATQSLWLQPLFEAILTTSGKDSTLTGRDELWRAADQLIAQRPWLGLGYAAFWQPGNLDAEALLRRFGVSDPAGFNFHNTPRDVVVALGYLGGVVDAVIAASAAAVLLFRTMVRPDPARILACALCVYFAMRLGFEFIGLSQASHGGVLVYMVFGLALVRSSSFEKRADYPRRIARPLQR